MKGLVIAAVCWAVALSPLLFLALRAKRAFLIYSAVFGLLMVGAWVSTAWFGIGYTENLTESLDGNVYVFRQGAPFQKGDLVAFRWHGGATYPSGTIFIKQVAGVPGDTVKRVDAAFWVNSQYIGIAKPKSKAGVPLAPAPAGVIQLGEYFVATPSADSLDSRYALAGNVRDSQVIGRAYALF